MTDLTTAKIITYNRDTRDFDATFEGNYIGSFRTMHQAECELNQHVLRLCENGLIDQPLAALAEQALTAALADDPPPTDDDPEGVNWSSRAAVPEGTPADDFSDVGPDAGRAIGRQWCRDRSRFLAVLSNLDRDAWTVLAGAYCAWMNRGGCGLAPEHVVLIWTKAVERDITLPARVFHAADASAESYAGMQKPQC